MAYRLYGFGVLVSHKARPTPIGERRDGMYYCMLVLLVVQVKEFLHKES